MLVYIPHLVLHLVEWHMEISDTYSSAWSAEKLFLSLSMTQLNVTFDVTVLMSLDIITHAYV